MDVRPKFEPRTGPSFLIESARLGDLSGLMGLSESLGFSTEAWRSLIAEQTSVCAKDAGGIVGFYAANHFQWLYEAERLRELRAALSVLCNRFRLAEEQIGFGIQVVVEAPYLHSELRAQLLQALLRNIGLRYHHLFTFCGKQNSDQLEALLHEGWRCFQEEDEVCYLTLDVAKALRRLASELVLRARVPRVAAATQVRASAG